jgi:hypothetical protein
MTGQTGTPAVARGTFRFNPAGSRGLNDLDSFNNALKRPALGAILRNPRRISR